MDGWLLTIHPCNLTLAHRFWERPQISDPETVELPIRGQQLPKSWVLGPWDPQSEASPNNQPLDMVHPKHGYKAQYTRNYGGQRNGLEAKKGLRRAVALSSLQISCPRWWSWWVPFCHWHYMSQYCETLLLKEWDFLTLDWH